MKVLLIAEAANPEWTSVPLEGWSHAMALREVADIHLVTQVRNAEAIRRTGIFGESDYTVIDSESVAAPLHRAARILRGGKGKGWTTVTAISALSYYYFERLVWQQFRSRLKAGEFSIVHRLTPLSPTVPSLLASKCQKLGVPFMMGPLNGGVPWPQWFHGERRQEKEWLAPLRDAHKLLPGYGATRRNCAAIIVGSEDTLRQLSPRYRAKTFYIPENAIDPSRFPATKRTVEAGPLRMLFLGRLVPYKGADMVLEAAQELLNAGDVELTIVGEGPQRQALEQKATELTNVDSVQFTGRVSHEQVYQYFDSHDVFTFPSIREFGGAVVLEAMAMGCVPIVVKYGGPAELISKETAFALEIGPRDQLVAQLRRILESLVSDRSCLADMSAAAIDRSRTKFTWQAKAREVRQVYDWVLNGGEKPTFAVQEQT